MKGESGESASGPGGEIITTWVSEDGVWHAQPEGEMNLATSPELKQKIAQALSEGGIKGIVVDMSKTTFVDSSFMGVLVGAFIQARRQELPVGLSGVDDLSTRKVMKDLGLDQVLPYVDEETTAEPEDIKRWAESHGARPALYKHQILEGKVLAFMFPGQEKNRRYEEISWEQFFLWLRGGKVTYRLPSMPGIGFPFYEIIEPEEQE